MITAKEFIALNKKNNKNKYGNNKVEVDGKVFDSKLEAEYYKQLKLRVKANDIVTFKTQPRYPLQNAFKKDGRCFQSIDYIADFEIHHNDGSVEVVDVKGKKTDVFRIKEKIFNFIYSYKLTLVTKDDL